MKIICRSCLSWTTPGFVCVYATSFSRRYKEYVSEKKRKKREWSDSARTQCTATQGNSRKSNNLSFLSRSDGKSIFCDDEGDNDDSRLPAQWNTEKGRKKQNNEKE